MSNENLETTTLTARGSSVRRKIADVAVDFVQACDTGNGWEACEDFCTENASFSAQCEELANISSVSTYCDWVRDLLTALPDAKLELKSVAFDEARNTISIYSVLSGSHLGEGGPVPPTGQSFKADYVYVIEFLGDRISHITKVWNSAWTLRELGWT